MSRPFWLRITKSKSAGVWSSGALGRSNSIPLNGNLRVTRRLSTLHWPWTGRDDDDIGMRMCIVAKPWYCCFDMPTTPKQHITCNELNCFGVDSNQRSENRRTRLCRLVYCLPQKAHRVLKPIGLVQIASTTCNKKSVTSLQTCRGLVGINFLVANTTPHGRHIGLPPCTRNVHTSIR